MCANWTGNKKVEVYLDWKVSSAEAMNQKKGKHGQKIFGEHSFIQRRAKFVKMLKTCEFHDFSVVFLKQIHHD